jgi:hypothetical protein
MLRRRRNILVVYALGEHRTRGTILDHLYAFKRHSANRYFYLNLAVYRKVPRYLRRVRFDAIIFHTTFLAQRWSPIEFREMCERAEPLKHIRAVRVAIPQDEFLQSSLLCEFINTFDVTHVFTAAPESEWSKIYATVDRSRVGFTTVLTGYLDEDSVERMRRIAAETTSRPTDIAYRAWHAAPWLGRHGRLKTMVADAFHEAGSRDGLRVDISTREQDTLVGDDWYRFLASAKYTIGVEGGASILDSDGTIKADTERYLADHPDAKFDEIEAHCFPGRDGELSLFALSPRHLEACATRTCQILVEGSYNGILRPGEHYIELRKDLSNLDAVIAAVKRDDLRAQITAAAWRDTVASGRCDYVSFVEQVERHMLWDETSPVAVEASIGYARSDAMDRLGWMKIALAGTFLGRLATRLSRTS